MTTTERQNKIANTAITRVLQHLILVNGMDPISVNSLAFGLIMKSLEDMTDKRTARDCINAAMNKAWGKPEPIIKEDDLKAGMAGYAMACCDIYRAGGEDYATEALLETGNGLQEFIDAGIDDERDIELITKIIPES